MPLSWRARKISGLFRALGCLVSGYARRRSWVFREDLTVNVTVQTSYSCWRRAVKKQNKTPRWKVEQYWTFFHPCVLARCYPGLSFGLLVGERVLFACFTFYLLLWMSFLPVWNRFFCIFLSQWWTIMAMIFWACGCEIETLHTACKESCERGGL